MRRVTLACTLLLPFAVTGCGGDIQSLLAPTPDPVFVNETFTGSLGLNGATSHPFQITSAAGGDVTAVLRVVTPDDTSVVGFSLGTWNGTACQAVLSNDRATVSASLVGRATSTGSLCVRIYDIGALTAPQDYQIDVNHP
jgi:hypothetical protein